MSGGSDAERLARHGLSLLSRIVLTHVSWGSDDLMGLSIVPFIAPAGACLAENRREVFSLRLILRCVMLDRKSGGGKFFDQFVVCGGFLLLCDPNVVNYTFCFSYSLVSHKSPTITLST